MFRWLQRKLAVIPEKAEEDDPYGSFFERMDSLANNYDVEADKEGSNIFPSHF